MKSLLIGTAKGLVEYDFSDATPRLKGTHFVGFAINMIHIDPHSGRWWVGIGHKHWGQKLHYTEDAGGSWEEAELPRYEGRHLPDGRPAKLKQIWCMEQGGEDQSNVIWLGTEPGGLFRSEDMGRTFQLVEALWNHPSRSAGKWFGAGKDDPFIHSIVVDPTNSDHVYIAVSCAGIFETKDGGQSWEPRNKGLVAAYLPNPNVDVGHDPHLLQAYKKEPAVLWQQNHCGIFYSNDGGLNWKDVSAHGGLPVYGFPIEIDQDTPGRAWVIPALSDEQRIAPGLRMTVMETRDFGATWFDVREGLPDLSFDIVLRHGFAGSGQHLAFGTTSGNVYWADKNTLKWKWLTANLTKVNCLFFT